MADILVILAAPFAACLVLTAILCYFGVHVIMREVIFVDLALAQLAALGVAIAAWFGVEPQSGGSYAWSLGFTLGGAGLLTVGRFRDRRLPQEAIIGIVYAVSTALALLVLARVPVEKDQVEHMLVGRLLFIDWPEVALATGICLAAGLFHFVFRDRFLAISTSPEEARARGFNVYGWDFLFYATLGLVVTSSVQMAGVLLVFSFLVVPAGCAMIFFASARARLLAGWLLGTTGSALGLTTSAVWDLPAGSSVVATFGAIFALCAIVYAIARDRAGGRARSRP